MKIKSLLTTITFLFMAALAGAQVSKQATARIMESQTKELSTIVLVYETGESEIIPLKNWRILGGGVAEVFIENQKIITNLLNEMAKKGYEISKMTSSGESLLYTFIVFTKKE